MGSNDGLRGSLFRVVVAARSGDMPGFADLLEQLLHFALDASDKLGSRFDEQLEKFFELIKGGKITPERLSQAPECAANGLDPLFSELAKAISTLWPAATP